MVAINKYLAGLAVALAIAAVTSPSLAQDNGNHMNSAREQALRDCNAKAGKMSQSTWGDHQLHMYRSCMADHGQQE